MEAREWLSDLGPSVCGEPDVEFAVAFASAVTGSRTPTSDVDVAVKFDESLSPGEQFRRLCLLSGSLQRSDAPFITVSNMETLPLQIARRAIDGEFLCGDESAFHRFRTMIEVEYGDRRAEIHQHSHDVIHRVARQGLRG